MFKATLLFAASVLSFLFTNEANALGGKRPQPIPVTQAYPARTMTIGAIYEGNFTLPDGATSVSMKDALPILMQTTLVDASTKIHVTAPGTSSSRYIISGGVTSFVANINKFGIQFGYTPASGMISKGTLPTGTGAVDVTIGQLDMDFNVVDTVTNTVVIAKYATAKELGISLTVQVDFGQISGGLSFVHSSPMTNIFRKAMQLVVSRMEADPNTNLMLDWKSDVIGVDYELSQIFFRGGLRDSIAKQNIFSVYDSSDRRIGEMQVDFVDADTARAVMMDETLKDSVRQGDVVKIYYPNLVQ